MAPKAHNESLGRAKANKEDEFYTQLEDVEQELKHYRKLFEGKVVYLNCDDPRVSAFFHFFSFNFEKFALKRLISTCYKNRNRDLFSEHASERAVFLEYAGDRDGDRIPGSDEIDVNFLDGDGDFRSAEAIGLLKQADIVVTNPPFSLFREYISQLIEYDKQFIILGSQNAITYKEIFPLLREQKVWLGANSGDMSFRVPDHYAPRKTRFWIDAEGQKWRSFGNMCWFTNMDYRKRHEDLILCKTYSPEDYPPYDNYDAIEISRVRDIPLDYPGVMGVTPGFLAKHNPDQFEIVGTTESSDKDNAFRTRWYSSKQCRDAYLARFGRKGTYDLNASGVVNGVKVFKRILIRNKKVD